LSKSQKGKSVTKDKLIDMEVIDGNGNIVGTVKDVAFTVGKMGISLSLESKSGEPQEIEWDDIQAIGDFIVLKPQKEATASASTSVASSSPGTVSQTICQTCKEPLSYIQQYQRWYCYKCKKYV
jgi:sporulation protein YlmC with PRC-barrel domain